MRPRIRVAGINAGFSTSRAARAAVGENSRTRVSPQRSSATHAVRWVATISPGASSAAQRETCVVSTISIVRSIAGALPNDDAIRVLPEGAMPAPDFLHALDIFYYRTGEHVETFGRVVLEAMACGLPVVCHRHGGYADIIRPGENGFLFDTSDEALAILDTLVKQPALRAQIGRTARETVEQLYSREAVDARTAFYLRRVSR